MIKIQLVIMLIILSICLAITAYSFKQCGWGMFAYQNSFIAAITKECAQQQNKTRSSH